MFFWHPTGRLGWFRGGSCVPSGSEIYSGVPVRIRKGHTTGAHLPPPLNRAPGAPPPPPLFPLWNGSRELNFSGRRPSLHRKSRCISLSRFSQEALSVEVPRTRPGTQTADSRAYRYTRRHRTRGPPGEIDRGRLSDATNGRPVARTGEEAVVALASHRTFSSPLRVARVNLKRSGLASCGLGSLWPLGTRRLASQ